jgi:hypothetical protein
MKRFDAKLLAGFAVTVALLVPLAVFGGSAFARSASGQHSSAAQYQYRVTICHVTGSKKHSAHTITVSSAAVAAHLRHGDHLGACTGAETRRAHGKPSGTATPSAGNASGNHASNPGRGNGNGNGQGNGNGNGHHK